MKEEKKKREEKELVPSPEEEAMIHVHLKNPEEDLPPLSEVGLTG